MLESFNWAIEGIVWALRHQRNMQLHVAAAIVVIFLSLLLSINRLEMLAVFAAITFVIAAELINTAIEYAIDLTADDHHPFAKIAKDVAAGAVLIASINALVVAYLVFYDYLISWPYAIFRRLRLSDVDLIIAALLLVCLIVVVVKAATHQRSFLRGGWPSGHAAVAFGAWVAITALAVKTAYATSLSAMAFVMAFLTAQSRVQTGVHSALQVLAGAALGTFVMLTVLGLFKPF